MRYWAAWTIAPLRLTPRQPTTMALAQQSPMAALIRRLQSTAPSQTSTTGPVSTLAACRLAHRITIIRPHFLASAPTRFLAAWTLLQPTISGPLLTLSYAIILAAWTPRLSTMIHGPACLIIRACRPSAVARIQVHPTLSRTSTATMAHAALVAAPTQPR